MHATGYATPHPGFCRPAPRPCSRNGEGGFLLAGGGVMILIIIALLSSFAFVTSRQGRFQANYAIGQRLGELTTLAHSYAQQTHYRTPLVNIDNVMIYSSTAAGNPLTPPDNFRFNNTGNIRYEVEILGRSAAPINGNVSATIKAASAYMHVRIRPAVAGAVLSPTDRIALLSGATSRNLSRVGVVDVGLAAGDTCDGPNPTRVRWGPETSACLNAGHIAALGMTDVQTGDLILPVWETALARGSNDALYRFPQPERPDMNTMNTHLKMAANSITDAGGLLTENLVASNSADMMGTMTIRFKTATGQDSNSRLRLQGPAAANNNLRIYDQTGTNATPLDVSGPSMFRPGTGNSLNIANTLQEGAPLTVNVVDPIFGLARNFMTDTINTKPGSSMLVQPSNKTLIPPTRTTIAAEYLTTAANTGLNIPAANGRFAVGGTLSSDLRGRMQIFPVPVFMPMSIYSAQLVTAPTGTTQITSPTWSLGGLDQTGSGTLSLHGIRTPICDGDPCPDKMTTDPEPEPLE